MRTYLDCYPCFLRQAVEASRYAGLDDGQQHAAVVRVLDVLREIDPLSTPPETGDRIHRIIREVGGDADPYREAKRASTERALAMYPHLKGLVAEADAPLDCAVRLAIAGNIIDFGPSKEFDLEAAVDRVLTQPFAIDDRRAFQAALDNADHVLYLADNAGETVFDRVLIECLPVPVVFAVKSGPILNDATMDDARAAGVGQTADLVETGSDAPGTILSRCSASFRRRFREAPLVIAKGQANYETLSLQAGNVFFLLQAKCPVIARDVGVPQGGIVVSRGVGFGARS